MKYVKVEPHRVSGLVSEAEKKALHIPAGKRFPVACHCHGHCVVCGGPVVMDRLGYFRHVE